MAHFASVYPFFRSRPVTSPDTYSRTRARGSARRTRSPPILNAARKAVFSRTLKTAGWASTTIAAGDTAEEIDKLRLGGDGHIVVWGGVSLWRSLMRLDLTDELQVSLFPYVAGEGTRLFDGVPRSYQLDPGLQHRLQQRDRRATVPAAPLTQRLSPQGGCDGYTRSRD